MSKKRDFLLCHLIEEYLKSGQPIGSQTLKISGNIKMSSATIRNHFKSMMDEGLLSQLHISGGRIPTYRAFRAYWREKIDLDKPYCFASLDELEKISEEIGCFVGAYDSTALQLSQLEVINESFLSLIFSPKDKQNPERNKEVLLRYSQPLKRFLDDLVGMELEDIQSFCLQVNASEVFSALNSIAEKPYRFFGARHITSFMQTQRGERLFFDLCSAKAFKYLSNGLYFDEPFPKHSLAFIIDAKVQDRDTRVLCCGELNKNYLIL